MKLSELLKPDDLIQLTHYSRVLSCNMGNARVKPDGAEPLFYNGVLDHDYIKSADYFEKTIPATKTELEEIFKHNPNTIMTVCFFKQAVEKDVAAKIAGLYPNKGTIMSKADFVKEAKAIAKSVIVGDERIARGRHSLSYGNGGRIHFIDMDKEHDESKDYDTRTIQVDPRTLQWIIVNRIKYILKTK